MDRLVKPNFFIAGAPKSGTTNISYYLSQHSNVFMPDNLEPYYFARLDVPEKYERDIISNEDEYLKLFNNQNNATMVGESSPVYLYCPNSPRLIKNFLPSAKIIISLRNPVEIAFSEYLSLKFMKFEKNLTFKQTIDFNEEQLQKNEFHIDSILESGFYYKHLSTFMNEFPADQIKIIIFEDYIKTPQKIIQSIFSFLGLKEFPNLIDPPKNSYRVPTNEGSKLLMNNSTFRKLSKRLIPTSTRQKFGDKFLVKESKRPPVPHEERNRLKKIYNDDVDSLKKLLDIKLPWNDFN